MKRTSRRTSNRRDRDGAIVLLLLGVIVVAVLSAALVLNWSYLVLAQRDMQHRTDLLGLAAARELLDEDLLKGRPANQMDDLQSARATGNLYREINNRHASPYLQIQGADVNITPGRIADITGKLAPASFTGSLPFNTLRVTTERKATGANPVAWLVNHFSREPVDVAARAYASLDNRVVGFRPTIDQKAPLAPFAIDANAWFEGRTWDRYPTGGNQIHELKLTIGTTGQPHVPNAAIVSFDGVVANWLVQQQIVDGVGAGDLPAPHQVLGPVHTNGPNLVLSGKQFVPSGWASQINQKLRTAAPPGQGCQRAFPLYRSDDPLTNVAAGRFHVIGFVAGRIIGESIAWDKIEFSLEPCFLVHPTVWTEPFGAGNTYVHKLRLSH